MLQRTFRTLTLAALVLSLGTPASSAATPAAMTFPGTEWLESTPEAQGVDSTLLNDAANYLRANAPSDGINELVIIRNGTLIWKGSGIDRRHGIWSCTKSFTSTVLGLLVDDGRTTLDTPVASVLSSLSATYPSVTFRHFTTMTSGYFAVGDDFSSHGQSGTPFTPSSTPLFAPPGSRYAYWDSAMNQFANGLTRVAGEPIEQLFKRRIADPIGMRSTDWNWGDWGSIGGLVVNGGAGNSGMMEITSRQLARLGHLFLNRGNWAGRQLISSAWVDAATRNQVPNTLPLGHPTASPIEGRGVYGFNWWANGIQPDGTRKWPGVPASTFSASGANNNDMFVIPDWGMVIVRLGLDEFSEFSISDATYATFLQKVGQSIGSAAPTPGPSVAGFTLVNADSDQDLGPLANGATINLATLPTRNLNVRANTSPASVGSVRFAYDGNASYRTETAAPYALEGDSSGNYNPWTPSLGTHSLGATPYGGAGTAGSPLSISFSVIDQAAPPPSGPALTSFTLINADNDQDLGPLANGATVDLAALPTRNLNVRANATAATGSVRFGLDGNGTFRTESTAPFALAGDAGGDYAAWTPSTGAHALSATPYSGSGGGGTAGTALSVSFTVTDGGGTPPSAWRIGLSHDGNQHDPDDFLGIAMAIAILGEAGEEGRLVHVDYSNHLGNNNPSMAAEMTASAVGAAQRWGVSAARLFDDQTNLAGAIDGIKNAINASTSSDRFYLVCAGPMEVAWRGINASDPAKRPFCTAVSHSSWNDDHADTTLMTHRWTDIVNSGVRTIHIKDQNAGLRTALSNWTWLRDSGLEAWRWLYSRNAAEIGNAGLFDCSDAGMVYYVLTGRGDQDANAAKLQDLFMNGAGGPSLPAVASFTLINADTDQPVAGFDPINSGATLNLGTLPTRNLNLRANVAGAVGSVRFGVDGNSAYRVESGAPYALAGDASGDYNPWTPSVGSHSVTGTPFAGAGASGTAGTSKTISFSVVDNKTAASANAVAAKASSDGSAPSGGGGGCGLLGIEVALLAWALRRRRRHEATSPGAGCA